MLLPVATESNAAVFDGVIAGLGSELGGNEEMGEVGVSDLRIAVNQYEFPAPSKRNKASRPARRSRSFYFPGTGSPPSAVPGGWPRSSRASSTWERAFRTTRSPSSRGKSSSPRTATRLFSQGGIHFAGIVGQLAGINFMTVAGSHENLRATGNPWWSGKVPRTTSPLSVLEGMVKVVGEATLSPCKPILAAKLQAKGR